MASQIALQNSGGYTGTLQFPDSITENKTYDLSEIAGAGIKAANGYQYLANGLIIQWGRIPFNITAGTTRVYLVSYPISFPNSSLQLQTTALTSTPENYKVGSYENTNSNFYISLNSTVTNSTQNVFWLAIGY